MHISVPSCSLKHDFDTMRHPLHNLAGPRDASIEMLGQSREQNMLFLLSHISLSLFCLYLLSLMRYLHHYLLLFTLTRIQPRVRI